MNETAAWDRLATLVKQRRQALDIKQDAVTGVSKATMSNIENAKQDSYKDFTLAALERALRWHPGSIGVVLDGGEPMPVDQPSDAATSDLVELAEQLRAGLAKSDSRDDKLSTIINLCEALTVNQAEMIRKLEVLLEQSAARR